MKDLLKTLIPILLGSVAGILSMLLTQGLRERDPFGIIILVLSIYVHKFIFPKIGIKIEPKDWAGISFLSFASWYISWTLLLNS
jgi:hypothetical protein